VFKAAKAADKKAKAEADAKTLVPGSRRSSSQTETSRRSKDVEDLQEQLKVIREELDRSKRERAEEMEEGGFTLSKTRAQKRKDKKPKAVAPVKKPVPTPSSDAGTGMQPRSCTVADIRDADTDDIDMWEGIGTEKAQVGCVHTSTKAQVEQLAKVVQDLTVLCKDECEGSLLCQSRDEKIQEHANLQARLKEEQVASRPVWRPVQEIATKCRKKRALADKARERHDEVTDELHKLEQALKDKIVEEDETRKAAEELAREADLLDAEYAMAQARLTVGNSKSSPAVQSLTQCLLEFAEHPSHEMLLAF